MDIVTVPILLELLKAVGINAFMGTVIDDLERDFLNWPQLEKTPRLASHTPVGVMELMPCADDNYFAFKYVNGHPANPQQGKLSVVALGVLVNKADGYPLLLSEMTLLTAIRTAATAALGARYMARSNSGVLAIIGTGAQAEFVAHAMAAEFPLQMLQFYDTDPKAMQKFANNMAAQGIALSPCGCVEQALSGADIVVTATAAKARQQLFTAAALQPGMHIHAMGGDCPGKTELGADVLARCKIAVEFVPQSLIEGEVQQAPKQQPLVELWQLVAGQQPLRVSDDDITLFDAVGFALEDLSVLKTLQRLITERGTALSLPLIPEPQDPKDLFALLRQ
jgi:ornithine cyclodeaminase